MASMGVHGSNSTLRSHLFAVAGEEVVTGAQHARATQMSLNIYGDRSYQFGRFVSEQFRVASTSTSDALIVLAFPRYCPKVTFGCDA
jgi:hypothetical protein